MWYRLQRHDGTDCSATMVPFTPLRMVPIQRYRHPYKSHFLLKGSSLLYALDGFKALPTIDIDLLGERISNDGVHRTVTVRRDSVTSVTRFCPVFTC